MNYCLMTAARNEAGKLERVMRSIVEQELRPTRWVVVSDGSTDGTDAIVQRFAAEHPWIRFARCDDQDQRSFASKAYALQRAEAELGGREGLLETFVGVLDADVVPEPDYFRRLLEEFERDTTLGLAGGRIVEVVDDVETPVSVSRDHVAGALQTFRREAYLATPGYQALRRGGIDTLIEYQVQIAGWKVRTFPELEVRHLGPVLGGSRGKLHARYRRGINNYLLGYHPLFQAAVSLFRFRERPYVLAGLAQALGYGQAWVRRWPREAPPEVVQWLQREQMRKLRTLRRHV